MVISPILGKRKSKRTRKSQRRSNRKRKSKRRSKRKRTCKSKSNHTTSQYDRLQNASKKN